MLELLYGVGIERCRDSVILSSSGGHEPCYDHSTTMTTVMKDVVVDINRDTQQQVVTS